MKREIQTIETVDGGQLPYICTCNVLAKMQKEHESIDAFYLKMIGKKVVVDEDGYEKRNEEGKRITKPCEPDVATANEFLTAMVNEALEMQGQKERYSVQEVVRKTDLPVFMRIGLLISAFNDCFNLGKEDDEEKNENPAGGEDSH